MDMHKHYMKRALELAKLGWGKTNPNPLVGAVIVKDNKIIGEGYHKMLGGDHAEIAAINNASCDVTGATLYVNLEPCSHQGRTPPCSRAIIKKGLDKVVIGMCDPNPKVSGNGIKMLKENGIVVVSGVLEDEAKKLNEIFIKYITQKRPFVTMKWAMTLDGKIATKTYDSKWISNDLSRQYVHTMRDRMAAIMVGSKTVIADNPSLTTRLKDGGGANPKRIVVDSQGIVPHDSNVFNNDGAGCILATTSQISKGKIKLLNGKGVQVLMLDGEEGHVDLVRLMDELYKLEIDSVLLEGGGGLNAAALDARIVDKVITFIAPKLVGGKGAITPVEGSGIPLMSDAIKLYDMSISRFGEDILLEGYVKGDVCLQE